MEANGSKAAVEVAGRGFVDRQLDWVAVLGREHAEEVFRRLHEVVKRDVESAKKHARADRGELVGFGRIEFHCSDARNGYFEVDAQPAGSGSAWPRIRRRFWLKPEGTRIVVRGEAYPPEEPPGDLHAARPALYAPQHCLLDVEGHERPMRLWQFSRLALEPLFFPSEPG